MQSFTSRLVAVCITGELREVLPVTRRDAAIQHQTHAVGVGVSVVTAHDDQVAGRVVHGDRLPNALGQLVDQCLDRVYESRMHARSASSRPHRRRPAAIEGRRPGLVGELQRIGAIDRRGDTWLVPSPALLSLTLRLDAAGMPANAIQNAFKIIAKQLGRLATDLASYFLDNTDALGDEPERAYEELRPVAFEAVRVVFAHEMERTLKKATESGAAAKFTRKKRKKP